MWSAHHATSSPIVVVPSIELKNLILRGLGSHHSGGGALAGTWATSDDLKTNRHTIIIITNINLNNIPEGDPNHGLHSLLTQEMGKGMYVPQAANVSHQKDRVSVVAQPSPQSFVVFTLMMSCSHEHANPHGTHRRPSM